MHGINDYLDACEYRRDFLQGQRQWMVGERDQHVNDAERLQGELDRVRQELAGYLIPEITDDYVEELEVRLSCSTLMPIKREFHQRFEAAERRQVELESMEEIQNFDLMIETANQNIEQVRPEYDRLNQAIGFWQDSKHFSGLNERGFFEPDYTAGFFRRFFDWRAVSLLMTHLSRNANLEFDNPDDLKNHYRDLRQKVNVVTAEFNQRVAERDRIDGLNAEYQDLLSTPERLLAELYRELGAATIEHLQTCPDAMRMRLASEDKHLNAFLQKDAGLQKQAQYLRELMVTRIESNLQQTEMELNKTERKIEKLQMQRMRGKRKFFSDDDIARMRNVKSEKWEKRRLKTEKLRRRISEFDKYDRGSCSEAYLWWDLMTREAPGDDIFEVREHRFRHPNWSYRDYRDPWHSNQDDDDVGLFDDAAEDLASSMAADNDAGLFDPS